MNNEYNNFVIPAYEEEDYCAEMISNRDLDFWDVLTCDFDIDIADGEDLVYIWLEKVNQCYDKDKIYLPDDPLETNDFLHELAKELQIDVIEAYYDGVGIDDIIA